MAIVSRSTTRFVQAVAVGGPDLNLGRVGQWCGRTRGLDVGDRVDLVAGPSTTEQSASAERILGRPVRPQAATAASWRQAPRETRSRTDRGAASLRAAVPSTSSPYSETGWSRTAMRRSSSSACGPIA